MNTKYIKARIIVGLRQHKRRIAYVKRNMFRTRKKNPNTIQLPITYKCNFDCVMCGMHHMVGRSEFTAEELGAILEDKLFDEVEYIGLNGGEPFLKNDILECVEQMLKKCKKLKGINIISNGYYTERILNILQEMKIKCQSSNVKLNLSLSIDGINDMQDFHRGAPRAFLNVKNTVEAILADLPKYVDSLGGICTITRFNIERINEVDEWAKKIGINMSYNLATENVRIENQDRVEKFSVFSDMHAKMLASEFFYSKFLETYRENYFGLFLFLEEGRRYAKCPCQYNEWVTLTPNCQIGYCATYSKELGSALDNSAYDIFNDNTYYLDKVREEHCSTCSHYMGELNWKGLKKLEKEENRLHFMKG